MSQVLDTIPSKSNPSKSYAIVRGDDGVVHCKCPAWAFQHKNKPSTDGSETAGNRSCKHLKEFFAKQMAKKEPVISKSVAASGLVTSNKKIDEAKRLNALRRAMAKGGAAAVAAARKVLREERGASSNLTQLACDVLIAAADKAE